MKDLVLLARTDEMHDYLSSPATKKIMEREWVVYGHTEFRDISQISIAHLYNLRRSHFYRSVNKRYTKTKPTVVQIGERARPSPGGSPGYIRIDTVHQGDYNDKKGVYHVNAGDELTQWEIVASVEKIAESYLVLVLESMLAGFPFVMRGFHSDNGPKFINKTVAQFLNKLLIRLPNAGPDTAMIMGWWSPRMAQWYTNTRAMLIFPRPMPKALNHYNSKYLNLYINFHRPCFFPVSVTDHRGKIRKTYPYQEVPHMRSLSHCPEMRATCALG
jgi:hypothetical protein